MSSLFFNGRSWVTPAVMSAIDDSKMYGRKPSDGNNLALIGLADGGQPNTPLVFGATSEALSVLRGGDLIKAVEKAFDASSQSVGPSKVTVIRVNPATQSALMLKDAGGEDAIQLMSSNYGLIDNMISVKVETGTNTGLKLTTQSGTYYNSVDDLERNTFSVTYTGTGLGTITVSNTSVALVLDSVATSISLDAYSTVSSLVDRLNAVPNITAMVLDGNGSKETLNALDGRSLLDITTTKTLTANLQAAIDWFNGPSEQYVTASRPAGATNPPTPQPVTFLTGGSNGMVTNAEWTAAFTTLQATDAQWVVPLSSSPSIHAMASAHVSYMSEIARRERRAVCGTALATPDADAIMAAKVLNSDRVSLTHLGIYDYDAAGKLVLLPPYFAAAMVGAAFAGMNPATPLTNKSLKIRGIERNLRNPTDTDALIIGGVLCIENTNSGFRVVKSISTWLNNENYNRREVSVGMGYDFVMRKVREALDEYRGAKNSPTTLVLARERTESVLRELSIPEPSGVGVLVGDVESPPYKNIAVSQEGDVLRVEFQASVALPVNYIPVVCYAVPYSASS